MPQNQPIKKKFILSLTVVALLGTLAGGVIIERTISNLMARSNTSLAVEIAKIEKERIGSAFRTDINLARLIANDQIIANWINNESDEQLTEQAMTILDRYASFSNSGRFFFIVDGSKNYYTNSAGDETTHSRYVYTVNVEDPSAQWYLDATQSDREYQLNLDADEVLGDQVSVYINYPVRDAEGKVIALTGTATPVQKFVDRYARNDEISAANVLLNAEGEVLIQHGDFYIDSASAKNGLQLVRRPLTDSLNSAADAQRVEQAFETLSNDPQQNESFELRMDDTRWVAAMTYIEDLDWYMLSMVQKSRTLSSVVFYISYGVFSGVFIVVLFFVWLFLDRIIIHRLKDLQQLAIRIYERSEIRKVQIEGDELFSLKQGLTEMQNKIHQQIFELESTVRKRTQELEVKNRELSELAVKDTLTGLLNRRGLLQQFSVDYHRAQREGSCLGVALLDIDNFKELNDRHGHKIGDQAIEAVADAIQSRSGDLHARWGGEEFVVVFHRMDEKNLSMLMARMNEAVEAISLQTEKGEISLTASIGGVLVKPEKKIAEDGKVLQQALEGFIGQADDAMYAVKQSGKAGNKLASVV